MLLGEGELAFEGPCLGRLCPLCIYIPSNQIVAVLELGTNSTCLCVSLEVISSLDTTNRSSQQVMTSVRALLRNS
jgi:hypothetical protein